MEEKRYTIPTKKLTKKELKELDKIMGRDEK